MSNTLKTFSIGGVHPDDAKIAKDCAIEVLPLPPVVYISMAQHLGVPAKPVVAVGDKLKVGQVIAEPGGFISAFVHSSVSGTVKSIGPRKDLAGNYVTHVEIAVEGDEWMEGIDLSDTLVASLPGNSSILDAVKKCGVVGLGGATFPTHVKLDPPKDKTADCLIINGAECEPYLTSDFRIMIEKSKEIVVGAACMQRVLGACPCVIAIEDNKPEAIAAMKKALMELQRSNFGYEDMKVVTLRKKYPQGGEKQLIQAVMGREVKSGALPIDVGAVVQNVATALAEEQTSYNEHFDSYGGLPAEREPSQLSFPYRHAFELYSRIRGRRAYRGCQNNKRRSHDGQGRGKSRCCNGERLVFYFLSLRSRHKTQARELLHTLRQMFGRLSYGT